MNYIIDGHNLIKSSFLKEYEKTSFSRAAMVLLDMLFNYRKKHPSIIFTLVFDGFADIRFYDKNIKILFSHDTTADIMIRKILEENISNNKMRTVVSDDREVQTCGKILGSKILNIKEFLNLIHPLPSKKGGKKTSKSSLNINIIQIEDELKNFYGGDDKNERTRRKN